MSALDLVFQLFALLLGLSIAELLAGLARAGRISVGATLPGEKPIRIGLLVPLLASLVLLDQTHFWLTAYELRTLIAFDYATLLGVLTMIGGYYVVSTFVFPDNPERWPDFDEYYLRTNRIVVAGLMAINVATLVYAFTAATGMALADAPLARSWISLAAALLFLPGLMALWYVKSRRANLTLLLLMNADLLVGAIGPKAFGV